MFENLLENIRDKFRENAERKAQDREQIRRINIEVETERKRIFEEELKKNSLEVATARAKKDAARLSGIQKLRAQNRVRNLNRNDQAPGSFFSKMSEYTQKNLARTEENKKRVASLRADAKTINEDRLNKKPFQQQNRTPSMLR